jgi:cell division septal protein FtsQ
MARPERRRALPAVEAHDLSLEAELETELKLRQAERRAERARAQARKAARRRFLAVTVVLIALVLGLAYLIVAQIDALFIG